MSKTQEISPEKQQLLQQVVKRTLQQNLKQNQQGSTPQEALLCYLKQEDYQLPPVWKTAAKVLQNQPLQLSPHKLVELRQLSHPADEKLHEQLDQLLGDFFKLSGDEISTRLEAISQTPTFNKLLTLRIKRFEETLQLLPLIRNMNRDEHSEFAKDIVRIHLASKQSLPKVKATIWHQYLTSETQWHEVAKTLKRDFPEFFQLEDAWCEKVIKINRLRTTFKLDDLKNHRNSLHTSRQNKDEADETTSNSSGQSVVIFAIILMMLGLFSVVYNAYRDNRQLSSTDNYSGSFFYKESQEAWMAELDRKNKAREKLEREQAELREIDRLAQLELVKNDVMQHVRDLVESCHHQIKFKSASEQNNSLDKFSFTLPGNFLRDAQFGWDYGAVSGKEPLRFIFFRRGHFEFAESYDPKIMLMVYNLVQNNELDLLKDTYDEFSFFQNVFQYLYFYAHLSPEIDFRINVYNKCNTIATQYADILNKHQHLKLLLADINTHLAYALSMQRKIAEAIPVFSRAYSFMRGNKIIYYEVDDSIYHVKICRIHRGLAHCLINMRAYRDIVPLLLSWEQNIHDDLLEKMEFALFCQLYFSDLTPRQTKHILALHETYENYQQEFEDYLYNDPAIDRKSVQYLQIKSLYERRRFSLYLPMVEIEKNVIRSR